MSQEEREQTHNYYHVVWTLLKKQPYQSILDVGCGESRVLAKTSIPDCTAIDVGILPRIPNVTCIQANVMTWHFKRTFEVVICLQVIEHVTDVPSFIERLFALSYRTVIVSLPFKWPRGRQPGHIYDPITMPMIDKWFKGRDRRTFTTCDYPNTRVVMEFTV